MLHYIYNLIFPNPSLIVKRSSKWPKLREDHLKIQPSCQVCNSITALNVHHVLPVHVYPEHELDPNNLITLCEGGHPYHVNCHFLFGHLNSWLSWNKNVIEDTKIWHDKIMNKPTHLEPKLRIYPYN